MSLRTDPLGLGIYQRYQRAECYTSNTICQNFVYWSGIYQLADLHSVTPLRLAADSFVCTHFLDVVRRREEFVHLPVHALLHFLRSEHLRVKAEHEVLEAAILWLTFDPTLRREHATQVLGAMRFLCLFN